MAAEVGGFSNPLHPLILDRCVSQPPPTGPSHWNTHRYTESGRGI